MAWQENSIMTRKGVAKGKPGIHHMITVVPRGCGPRGTMLSI